MASGTEFTFIFGAEFQVRLNYGKDMKYICSRNCKSKFGCESKLCNSLLKVFGLTPENWCTLI